MPRGSRASAPFIHVHLTHPNCAAITRRSMAPGASLKGNADSMTRRALGRSAVTVMGAVGSLRRVRAEETLKLRCSLDTAPSHVRNVSIVDYLKKVEDATGGKITSEVFHSGQLYADLNVGKALLQGQVDMAVPGAWT